MKETGILIKHPIEKIYTFKVELSYDECQTLLSLGYVSPAWLRPLMTNPELLDRVRAFDRNKARMVTIEQIKHNPRYYMSLRGMLRDLACGKTDGIHITLATGIHYKQIWKIVRTARPDWKRELDELEASAHKHEKKAQDRFRRWIEDRGFEATSVAYMHIYKLHAGIPSDDTEVEEQIAILTQEYRESKGLPPHEDDVEILERIKRRETPQDSSVENEVSRDENTQNIIEEKRTTGGKKRAVHILPMYKLGGPVRSVRNIFTKQGRGDPERNKAGPQSLLIRKKTDNSQVYLVCSKTHPRNTRYPPP